MMQTLISNTGPILALSGAGHLELIKHLYGTLTVPDAVHNELIRGGVSGFGVDAYTKADWIEVETEGDVDPLLLAQLDAGESAVIALALQRKTASVLIDERRARKIARQVYGLNVVGTVGILLESKNAGLIDNVGIILGMMRRNGYWIHDTIVDHALRAANEKLPSSLLD